MKHPLLVMALLFTWVIVLPGQSDLKIMNRRYATQSVMARQLKIATDTERKSNKEKEGNIKKFVDDQERKIQYPKSLIIPVVFHFLYLSGKDVIYEKEALNQLVTLNRDFSDSIVVADKPNKSHPAYKKEGFERKESKIGISFCLAQNSKKELGIVKVATKVPVWGTDNAMKSTRYGGSTPWDTERYLNVWVVHFPDSIGGYAQMPGGAPETDGVVIDYRYFGNYYYSRKPYNQGRTLSHLVGSYLGLHELWSESTPCGDDMVDDTPIHNAPNYGPVSGYQHVSTCDGYPVEMTMNIMDATDDISAFMFTAGQKKRIQSMLLKGGPREKLGQGGSLCQKEEKPKEKLNIVITPQVRQLNLQAYPNPAQDNFTLVLNPPAAGLCDITVFNFSGQIMTKQQYQLDEGYYQTEFTTHTWPSGLYVIHCRINGITASQTINILRN